MFQGHIVVYVIRGQAVKLSLEIDDAEILTFAKLLACKVAEELKPHVNQKASEEGNFMSLKEAEIFLGVKDSWLYNNYKKEGIPCYKIAGLKFKKSELIKWTKTRTKI